MRAIWFLLRAAWAALLMAAAVSGWFLAGKKSVMVKFPPTLRRMHHSATANFGIPHYGGSLVGAAVYTTEKRNEGEAFSFSFKTKPGALPTFVLLDRGEQILPGQEENLGKMVTYRKLKEINPASRTGYRRSLGNNQMYDYPGYDPVPSSKASVRPGPIEHGTPLMPFIPGPTPPGPSSRVEAPEPSVSIS